MRRVMKTHLLSQRPRSWNIGDSVWLVASGSRRNMTAEVVSHQTDANGEWEYSLKDSAGSMIEGGRFFNEDQLESA